MSWSSDAAIDAEAAWSASACLAVLRGSRAGRDDIDDRKRCDQSTMNLERTREKERASLSSSIFFVPVRVNL